MFENKIFESALALNNPWYIKDIKFDSEKKQLDIYVDFKRGSTFFSGKSDCTKKYKVKDTCEKRWRHLNFFEHECYIHCRTPRIDLGNNKTELISPPWAGENSGFTLLFEALVMELCTNMPVHCVCKIIKEHDNKIWRMLEKYIDKALEVEDYSTVSKIGIDETSRRRGHNYITLFMDLKKKKTIHVSQGKDSTTIKEFVNVLEARNGSREQIKEVSSDMSPAFIKGINTYLPEAEITFDKFHVMKLLNEAVDKVRREEAKTEFILKKSRYVFLKNRSNLTKAQNRKLEELLLPKLNLKSIRALHIRENFQEIYKATTEESFLCLLKKWYFWATHSRLKPIIEVAKTIKSHWDGIVSWKRTQINNGILEGFNSVIQAAKAKARGYKTFKSFRIIAFLLTGKLDYTELNPYIRN